jgi:NAD(P)-dependent dehydrogenase (short-subunit alcohol dehydrogenase family)
MTKQKVVFITGTSRGIGRHLFEHLEKLGYIVYGSSRNGQSDQKYHLQLDVTNFESCQKSVERIIADQGRLDVLINNAGSHLTGASEETTLQEIDAQMQLNFYGAINMVKAVTPLFLEQKSGKIINMSSLGGLLALPFTSAYNASKFALEGYAESLRLELLPFGIYVSNLTPAYINSGTTDQSIIAPQSNHPLFSAYRHKMHQKMMADSNKGIPLETISGIIQKIIATPRPGFRYKVGRMSKLLTRLSFFLPEAIFQNTVLKTFNIPTKVKY